MIFCRECYALRDKLIAKLAEYGARLNAANEHMKDGLFEYSEEDHIQIVRTQLEADKAMEALKGHEAMHKRDW